MKRSSMLTRSSDPAVVLWAKFALAASVDGDAEAGAQLQREAQSPGPYNELAKLLLRALEARYETRAALLVEATLWLRTQQPDAARVWKGWEFRDGRIVPSADSRPLSSAAVQDQSGPVECVLGRSKLDDLARLFGAEFESSGLDSRAVGKAQIDEPHRLLRRASRGAGDSGDAQAQVGIEPLAGADRHGLGDFSADRSVSLEQRTWDAEPLHLGFVGVADDPARIVRAHTRNCRDQTRHQAAGARLGGRDRRARFLQPRDQAVGHVFRSLTDDEFGEPLADQRQGRLDRPTRVLFR